MGAKFYRSVGLELVGVKSEKSCLVVLDHYPDKKRLLMVELQPLGSKNIDQNLDQTDKELLESISARCSCDGEVTGIGIHAPLSLPPLFIQGLGQKKIPWMEQNKNPEVQWMKNIWKNLENQARPFCPYLQRPTEIWLRHLTKEHFPINEGFGSNTAPLLARMLFLQPYINQKLHEVFPKASMIRLVSSLGLPKWLATSYSDLEKGAEAREEFMKGFNKKCPQIFIYQRDFDSLIQNLSAFNAWICALTQHLVYKKLFEQPPKSYPKKTHFIRLPIKDLSWNEVF